MYVAFAHTCVCPQSELNGGKLVGGSTAGGEKVGAGGVGGGVHLVESSGVEQKNMKAKLARILENSQSSKPS